MEDERTFDQIARANLDYFYRLPEHAEKRQEFIDRGLVPTNNLCLYFFESSQQDLKPGMHNPHDYHYRPFGSIMQNFRDAHPELWNEAKQAAEASSMAEQKAWEIVDAKRKELIETKPEGGSVETFDLIGFLSEEIRQAANEAYWKKAEVFTHVFKILAPELEAAGIDPLDVCR